MRKRPKTKNNRTIRLNKELTSIHKEVLENLNSIHGALLCMNRSIQEEGAFGIIKCDKSLKIIYTEYRYGYISAFVVSKNIFSKWKN